MSNFDWPTQFAPLKSVPTEPGNPEHIEYVGRFNESGEVELVEVGRTNIYDEIQSHADSCALDSIIRRYLGGETDVLERTQGVFVDFSGVPTTLAGWLNLMQDGQRYFDGLPVEIRALFGHDIVKFMAAYGTEDFYKLLGTLPDSAYVPVEETKGDDVSAS